MYNSSLTPLETSENARTLTNSLEISKDQLTSMASLVEKAVTSAIRALTESEPLIAQDVIENDKTLNSYEIDIDNSTYNILAISQVPPEALRIILSIQKINAILERIGDHAVNIAESAISLSRESNDTDLLDLPQMAKLSIKMFEDALNSFFNKNTELAQTVLSSDENIDDLNILIGNNVKTRVQEGKMCFDTAMEIIRVSKNLERIADLSSNIAEATCFSYDGAIIKHHAIDR
ncbi:MAG: phosphate signaling complex protein PhoU [Chitinivibrionales bacterium]